VASSQRCSAVTSTSGYCSLRPTLSYNEQGGRGRSLRYKPHTRYTSVRVSRRLLARFFKGRVGKGNTALAERVDPITGKVFSILELDFYEDTFLQGYAQHP